MYQKAALRKDSAHYKWRIMLSCTELCPREEKRELSPIARYYIQYYWKKVFDKWNMKVCRFAFVNLQT